MTSLLTTIFNIEIFLGKKIENSRKIPQYDDGTRKYKPKKQKKWTKNTLFFDKLPSTTPNMRNANAPHKIVRFTNTSANTDYIEKSSFEKD